jgi:hypothetical protein
MATVIWFATIAVILLAFGLNVFALRDIRRYTPAGLLPDNMFELVAPGHVFSSNVPRWLQRRYLLSLLLIGVALSGAVTLSSMLANYSRAILFGFLLVPSLVQNVACWRRFRKSSQHCAK